MTRPLPKIGMRIVKSAIAVFLCFVIHLLRGRGMPFYSAIAAVLCMQPYVSNSVRVALNRTVGTFIGGLFGMLALVIEKAFLPPDQPIWQYLLVSVCILPLIYLTLLAKKPTASYITCVVFMSITVSHGADVNPYLFALDRCIDTLIGIAVSLGVNLFHLPRRKNRHLLFALSLDALAGEDGHISSYTRIKLNQLISRGARIAVIAPQPPAYFLPLLQEVGLRLPVATMEGAALYDTAKQEYTACRELEEDDARAVTALLEQDPPRQGGPAVFRYAVIHQVLHVYYGELTNPAAEELYHASRGSPHQYYVCGTLPEHHAPLLILAADAQDRIDALAEKTAGLPCAPRLRLRCRPDPRHAGYAFLEIYSAEATVDAAIRELCRLAPAERAVCFGLGPEGKGPTGDALTRAVEKEFFRRSPSPEPDSPLP